MLTALHLSIALWLVVGVSYAAGEWFRGNTRMDFVRFSGELFIYYVLLALGGGVFIMFTMLMFNAIGINAELLVQRWLLPCGIAGAGLVGAWLVEAKQSVIVNLAWSAVVTARFLAGHAPFAALERWQTAYLPIDSAWAAFVVIAFPPIFSFI